MTEFEQATDDVPITPISPGAMLLQARERAGITQEQVARELHITMTKVKSIESDDYLRLNTDTFIRGYLRAYANFLKLDSAPIIAAYQQHATAQGLVTEPQYPISKEACQTGRRAASAQRRAAIAHAHADEVRAQGDSVGQQGSRERRVQGGEGGTGGEGGGA